MLIMYADSVYRPYLILLTSETINNILDRGERANARAHYSQSHNQYAHCGLAEDKKKLRTQG